MLHGHWSLPFPSKTMPARKPDDHLNTESQSLEIRAADYIVGSWLVSSIWRFPKDRIPKIRLIVYKDFWTLPPID